MINHKRKFLYTHYPKCGGTTVRSYFLNNYAEGIDEEIEDVSNRHCSLTFTLNCINKKNFNTEDYYKFSFARNPFSLCVSFYIYNKTNLYESLKSRSLPIHKEISFCLNNSFKDYVYSDFCKSYFDEIYMHEGEIMIDQILKQETLQKDFDILCSKLKLKHNNLELINTTNHKNYRRYYDIESIKVVEEKFNKELNLFDYCF